MADWVTISSLATAGGTLVLAGATFAAVRSSNRAARVAERTLLAAMRPLLVTSRLDDPHQKIFFADGTAVAAAGGHGAAELRDDVVYLAISLRNAGTGIALLHAWRFEPEAVRRPEHAPLDEFQRLTRDIYVAAGDVGFWQGAFRDPAAPGYVRARAVTEERTPFSVEVLYGDHEGGQRMVSRFIVSPAGEGRWLATSGRHWNLDRPDPR